MNSDIAANLAWAEGELARNNIENARLDAEVLLAHTLKARRFELYLNKEKNLTPEQMQKFFGCVKRRQKREPIAYIVGSKEFWSINLKVTPDVLIPRPETEGIVEQAIKFLSPFALSPSKGNCGSTSSPRTEKIEILDLCTGSGCVAAALATEFPVAKITVADISSESIEVARQNLAFAGDRITFLTGDLFNALHESRKFDLITANPPYIAENDFRSLEEDIRRYEPRGALLAGPDGLAISKRIIQDAPKYLKLGGSVIMEMGIGQAETLTKIAEATGQYKKIEVLKDYSGVERILWINS